MCGKPVKKLKVNRNVSYYIDLGVIILAVLTLICNLLPTKCGCLNYVLCFISGGVGLVYLFSACHIFIFHRPKFDWHLLNGNYLAKVVALVLLFPSILTSFFLLFNYCSVEKSQYSPKNLIFDENLYSFEN